MNDAFRDGTDLKTAKLRTKLLANGLEFDPENYEVSEAWVPAKTWEEVHSTAEMVEFMEKDPKIQLEANVLGTGKDGQKGYVKMDRDQFLAAAKRRDSKRIREAIDCFGTDTDPSSSRIIGSPDFTPLLGGPFNKQLYYRDYLRMISACFFAYHHDPVARAIVSIMTDFTMGRGFQVVASNPAAQMLWDAFVEVNDFHRQMDYFAVETSIYGENMWWWLPNNQARISFNPSLGEKPNRALIPRVRLIDPSNIAEIITIPEDIVQGVLYYVWLAPTQYQMWTRDNQPSAKFIYTQIPADQIIHTKVNSVSNEKRGRSDYFPALGYMKRLRDGVNYGLVAQQKAAAWCIDTTIDGNDSDMDAYLQAQQQLGAIPTAGSEFVHTKAIERQYLSNSAHARGGDSPVFAWCLNMVCMSSGIPMSYLGTHLSGGGTRASALVATEPVAKRFERRQLVYQTSIQKIFQKLMLMYGIEAEAEIIFPELITQDRSAKLRDLALAQANNWFSRERSAEIAAKEFEAKNFSYQDELEKIKADDDALGISPADAKPLTTPGSGGQDQGRQAALTAKDRTSIKKQLRTL